MESERKPLVLEQQSFVAWDYFPQPLARGGKFAGANGVPGYAATCIPALETVLTRYWQLLAVENIIDILDRPSADESESPAGQIVKLADAAEELALESYIPGRGRDVDKRPINVEEIRPVDARHGKPGDMTCRGLSLSA